jgi:L-ascorbate metabolism protein UlaG (beta-lactamase superfamily)
MKITKYPQSCLLLEHAGSRLLIDPGMPAAQKFSAQDLLPVDGILITHEHRDHADPEFIRRLVEGGGVPMISNQSVKGVLGDLVTKVVQNGEKFRVGNFIVTAHEIPHVDIDDGSAGPQNTGYVVDDKFFAPGDSVRAEGIHAEVLALPLAGPDISPRDSFDLLKQVGAKTAIPIHYDVFLADPDQIAERAAKITPDVQFVVLKDRESIEI